jgi:protein SCO1/2
MSAAGFRYGWDDRIGQFAHIAAVAVLTPDGRVARWLYGIQPQGNDLRLALTEAGQGRIGDLGDQLLLLCYHYDPHTGRYSGLVWTLLRVGGLATLAAILGFVALALIRERRTRAREARR